MIEGRTITYEGDDIVFTDRYSTALDVARYNPNAKTLDINWIGSLTFYRYKSVGAFLNKCIVVSYKFEKMPSYRW